MRPLLTSLLVFLLCSSSLATLPERLQELTCRVCSGASHYGTGVFVTRKIGEDTVAFVWTAAHIFQKENGEFLPIQVATKEIQRGRVVSETRYAAVLVRYDTTVDLALLMLDARNVIDVSAVFDTRIPQVGAIVYHCGNPHGFDDTVTRGVISHTGRDGMYQMDSAAHPGSSGGGVFSVRGRVLGIVLQQTSPVLNFFRPSREIAKWANDVGISWAVNDLAPVPSIEEILEGAVK